ncbi:MAG: slipin family protein [Negativicutes bacterium]
MRKPSTAFNYSELHVASGAVREPSLFPLTLFLFLFVCSLASFYFLGNVWIFAITLAVAVTVSMSVKIAAEWEKAVVLRLGKYQGLKGPGCFWVVPFIDSIPYWIDQRVFATPFIAEQTLTKDTVPVNVDAILFWMVWDPEKAALEVENYKRAVAWTAQTALRAVVGHSMLAEILSGRDVLDKVLQDMIDKRTVPWGISVQSVEIRDVVIPEDLQDAMSREAQAERERRARIILGAAEMEIARNFVTAAGIYEENPVALQLRAMNILHEGLKEKGGLIITPSGLADSLNFGSLAAVAKAVAEKSAGNIPEKT